MKTTVVPAQITTVEDRIAGSLTFPQIVLLIIPLLTGALTYVGIPPLMHLGVIKLGLIIMQCAVFGFLALRFRGKIVAEWLVIYLRFSLRPRRYVFTKNDIASREIEAAFIEEISIQTEPEIKMETVSPHSLLVRDKIKIDRLLENPSLTMSFKLGKKGGLDVSLKPIKE